MSIKNIINWKIYFILLTASILSIVALFPYILSLQGDLIREIPLPLPLILILSTIQNAVIFGMVIFGGLFLSKKIGFGIKYLDEYLQNKNITSNMKDMFKKSVLLGVGVGILILLMDILFKNMGVVIGGEISIPIWQGFLASFYGGISEEILLRLFLMTLVIWFLNKILKTKENCRVIWFAIIITAILFGIGHLPAVASIAELTPLVIFRTILLNAIGGIVFGYLYWKQGLESSILAHFSADIVLHVLFPMTLLVTHI